MAPMFDPRRYETRRDIRPAPIRHLFFNWAPNPPTPLKKHSGEARFRNVDRADYSSPPAGRPAENNDTPLKASREGFGGAGNLPPAQ